MLRRGVSSLLLLTAVSCVGTARTRGGLHGEQQQDTFGWPLYAALVADVELLADGRSFGCRGGELERWAAFPSVPVDFVLDTVLLPIDVVCGIAGMDRRPRPNREPNLPRPLPFRLPEQDR